MGMYSACYQKRNENTKPATNSLSTMVYYLQDILEQRWHKACRSNQPISDLTEGTLQEMKPILDTICINKNLKLHSSGTKGEKKQTNNTELKESEGV